MLISSDRHTEADLTHWSDLARLDAVRSIQLMRSSKPGKAVAQIRAFVAAGPCYLGTSWGKDSVVTLHLAVAAGVRVPVVHIVQDGPQRDPEQHLVRDAFLARFDLDYHEVVVESLDAEQEDGGHAPQLDEGIRRVRAQFGTRRWISGLRAEESAIRKLRARRGALNSCWPIAWWTGEEVFAWLAAHDLPIHPAYAMTHGGHLDRKWLRVSIIGGKKGRGFGRLEWEREYYGDELLRLGL